MKPGRIMPRCAVCGGADYTDRAVLWDLLVQGRGLSAEERAVVDRQQGTCCMHCGGNLRSIALVEVILAERGFDGTLEELVAGDHAATLRLLEINEAGTLSPTLRRLPSRVFGAYHALDMQAMHFADGGFDLFVHSDKLEHVLDPPRALRECARVLAPADAAARRSGRGGASGRARQHLLMDHGAASRGGRRRATSPAPALEGPR